MGALAEDPDPLLQDSSLVRGTRQEAFRRRKDGRLVLAL